MLMHKKLAKFGLAYYAGKVVFVDHAERNESRFVNPLVPVL